MAYCSHCGAELNEGITVCPICGAPVNQDYSNEQPFRERIDEEELIKCPNCGKLVGASEQNCPSCGCEIHGEIDYSNVLYEFSIRLKQTSTDKERAEIIKDFSVPETKEGILKFLSLAASNINENLYYDDEVYDAWETKINQAYQTAQMAFGNQPEFSGVQEMFDKSNDALKNAAKIKSVQKGDVWKNKWISFFLCLFLGMFGAHKFYEEKYGMGLLYLYTFGLLGIGWIADIITLARKPNPYLAKTKNQSNKKTDISQ